MKKLLALICVYLSFFSVAEASYTTPTKVLIAGEMTNVCNFYYEILYKGERIQEELELELLDKNGLLISVVKTKDGIVDIEKVPLGEYYLKVKETAQEFPIKADMEYVKKQHLLKTLNLQDVRKIQTGDQAFPLLYVTMYLASATAMCIFVWKRRKSSE